MHCQPTLGCAVKEENKFEMLILLSFSACLLLQHNLAYLDQYTVDPWTTQGLGVPTPAQSKKSLYNF